jgi:hypothetical protein
MARQTYYITREQKNPLYRTRMLQAGPIQLDASAARLYRKLGVELSDEAPKRAPAKPKEDERGTIIEEKIAARVAQPKAKPSPSTASPKSGARKTRAKRKAAAKK